MKDQLDQAFLSDPSSVHGRYQSVRERSVALLQGLSAEDCCAQSMPDASPVKWHLAHTTWFFETFLLERFEPGFRPHHPAFRVLFNSYYNAIGDKYARPQRGLLTRPSLDEVLAYRRNVDRRMTPLLARLPHDASGELAGLVELGLQHEQQHQELMLTDVKHLLSTNPLKPAYADAPLAANAAATALDWRVFEAGVVEIGHHGAGFCFDNETPRHRQFVERFALASRLVTNGEFLAFVEAGGYGNAALWLSEGWEWVSAQRLHHPLYWQPADEGAASHWQEFTLHGSQPLDLNAAATHLSLFEADAYARWAGARLPTEAEWEHAAAHAQPQIGEHANEYLHPRGAHYTGMTQLFGAGWQWTASSYAPYPGYAPQEGAVGEYNGKFMVNQYVLRGSSCVTPAGHARASYRNFFPATARWQFTGIRLAKS
ncbi:MAG TPA: ergothioneine biosynthesis protein EgtB [Oxalobacteraceae bacterium]|nr:ergothioneine biosynthesis protein EgtB [Oxalobacteraceae bacterium]